MYTDHQMDQRYPFRSTDEPGSSPLSLTQSINQPTNNNNKNNNLFLTLSTLIQSNMKSSLSEQPLAFTTPVPLSHAFYSTSLTTTNTSTPTTPTKTTRSRPYISHIQITRATMHSDATNPNTNSTVLSSRSSFNAETAIRPELLEMAAYTPILPYDVLASKLGRDPSDIVKLDANENPYGPAPSVRTALSNAEYLHIYPDPESTRLRQSLSLYTGIPSDYLLVGAGADELIDLLFRLFITPASGDSIVNVPPTFGMYKFDGDVNGAIIHNIPRNSNDFSIDIDAIENLFDTNQKNPPKLLFVASPNNPDGSILSDSDLQRLLKLPTLVIVDEAYFEFSQKNRLKLVPQTSNLVVLRTFSKWAGLAGMRIGYGAFPLNIIKHLWKIKQPYNVSVAAQVAAIASINEKEDLLGKVKQMIAQRQQFYRRVEQFPWLQPFPSQSNYVLCRVTQDRSAANIKTELSKRGILIRYYTSPGLQDCIRISMGTEQQMERLYQALGEL